MADASGYKHLQVDVDRARYWLGTGAQPSETVARLLAHMIPEVRPLYPYTGDDAGAKSDVVDTS